MTAIDPTLRATKTTCPYCGVGCGVLATPDGKGGAAIAGDDVLEAVRDVIERVAPVDPLHGVATADHGMQ